MKVKFWVESNRMKKQEMIKTVSKNISDNELNLLSYEYAEMMYGDMFHLTEAIIRYGWEKITNKLEIK